VRIDKVDSASHLKESKMTKQTKVLVDVSLKDKITQNMIDSYHLDLEQSGFTFLSEHRHLLIPASLSAISIAEQELDSLSNLCYRFVGALQKVCEARRTQIITRYGLSEIERKYLQASHDARSLATIRIDLFPSAEGFKVLEVNSTIPAMQAYSDMIAEAWIKNIGGTYGMRSNSLDLLRCLEHLAFKRTGKMIKKIGIMSRPHDAQTSELKWFQKKWHELGFEVTLGLPHEFKVKRKLMYLAGQEVDVIYRHIFASKLDIESEFSKALLSGQFAIFNEIAIDLELKDSLVLLGENISLLTEEEKASVDALLPWTREIREGKTNLLHGTGDLKEFILNFKNSVIIKSSFGYGGKLVFSSDTFQHEESLQTLKELMGSKQLTWEVFVNYCFQNPGKWIVQEKIAGQSIEHSWIRDQSVETASCWLDLSLFLTLGGDYKSAGGSCRFAKNRVVNLGAGGGMIPLVIPPKTPLPAQ
jgi:hypothetical protein